MARAVDAETQQKVDAYNTLLVEYAEKRHARKLLRSNFAEMKRVEEMERREENARQQWEWQVQLFAPGLIRSNCGGVCCSCCSLCQTPAASS